jgi:hypothetical protein
MNTPFLGLLERRSTSLRSRYRHDADLLPRASASRPITEDDLRPLPALVQTYLRRVGVVGRPRVHDLFARFHGRMQLKLDGPAISFTAEQHGLFGAAPARLFFIEGARFGLSFTGYHRYVGANATMEIRFASIVPVADARGPKMNQGETVTLFNDMCLLAPASLIDAKVDWRVLDEHRVGATFHNAGQTIGAELTFDERGDLVSFSSNDRFMSEDGKTYRNYRWTTPVHEWGEFDGYRLMRSADASWSMPQGEFVYAHFVLDELHYDVAARP